jgi:hypothetical protein
MLHWVWHINDPCSGKSCSLKSGHPDLILLVAPVIPLALAAFMALNLAATRLRSVHLQRLEYALQVSLSEVHSSPTEPSFHTDAGLVFRPMDRLDKPYGARTLFAAVTFLAYVPILAALLGFTWFSVFHIASSGIRTGAIWGYGIAEGVGSWHFSALWEDQDLNTLARLRELSRRGRTNAHRRARPAAAGMSRVFIRFCVYGSDRVDSSAHESPRAKSPSGSPLT